MSVDFENTQWKVTSQGIDCKEIDYEIDIARMGERDNEGRPGMAYAHGAQDLDQLQRVR
jgi:hypothetical protein